MIEFVIAVAGIVIGFIVGHISAQEDVDEDFEKLTIKYYDLLRDARNVGLIVENLRMQIKDLDKEIEKLAADERKEDE